MQNGLPKRVTALTFAFKRTGERKYLDRAAAEMLELCRQPAFLKQNRERNRPGLPEASGVTGLAYGYDALRDDLPPDTVREIERFLLDWFDRRMYEEDGTPRDTYANNWTHVIWGGTVVAAVALAEQTPRTLRGGDPRRRAAVQGGRRYLGAGRRQPGGDSLLGLRRPPLLLYARRLGDRPGHELRLGRGPAAGPLRPLAGRRPRAGRRFSLRGRGPAELLGSGPLPIGP